MSKGRGIVIQTLYLVGRNVIFLQFLLSWGWIFVVVVCFGGEAGCVCVLVYTKLCNFRPSLPDCSSNLYAPLLSDTEQSL